MVNDKWLRQDAFEQGFRLPLQDAFQLGAGSQKLTLRDAHHPLVCLHLHRIPLLGAAVMGGNDDAAYEAFVVHLGVSHLAVSRRNDNLIWSDLSHADAFKQKKRATFV